MADNTERLSRTDKLMNKPFEARSLVDNLLILGDCSTLNRDEFISTIQ